MIKAEVGHCLGRIAFFLNVQKQTRSQILAVRAERVHAANFMYGLLSG